MEFTVTTLLTAIALILVVVLCVLVRISITLSAMLAHHQTPPYARWKSGMVETSPGWGGRTERDRIVYCADPLKMKDEQFEESGVYDG